MRAYVPNAEFSSLLGKTLVSIQGGIGVESIIFTTNTGERFTLYHDQDCCESVQLNDIAGDPADVLNSPLVMVEESSSNTNPEDHVPSEYQDDSFTWTFYKLATINGSVTLRWYGSSNGYYSESVSFARLD